MDISLNIPQSMGGYYIREANPIDFCLRAEWPDYPDEFALYNSSAKGLSFEEQIDQFKERNCENSLILSVLNREGLLIGHLSLYQIDRECGKVGNMGIRIHPLFCNQGIGSLILEWLNKYLQIYGIHQVDLDVMRSNKRAIHCYEKAGFKQIDEITRNSDSFYIMRKQLH